jgi:hypothetical protein
VQLLSGWCKKGAFLPFTHKLTHSILRKNTQTKIRSKHPRSPCFSFFFFFFLSFFFFLLLLLPHLMHAGFFFFFFPSSSSSSPPSPHTRLVFFFSSSSSSPSPLRRPTIFGQTISGDFLHFRPNPIGKHRKTQTQPQKSFLMPQKSILMPQNSFLMPQN